LAVNRELVLLYWQIGRNILARQAEQGWGAKVIERLTHGWTSCPLLVCGQTPEELRTEFKSHIASVFQWFMTSNLL
jgi:hypothetical protein